MVNSRLPVVGVITALVLVFVSPVPAEAADQTAKAALAQVLASAKNWQGDAILVHLSSVRVKSDGSALEWKYSFYSPKTQKRCVLTARGGGVTVKEVRLGNYTEPLGEFVNSDKAMEVAKKNIVKGDEPSMSVGRPAGGKADSTYWIVSGGWKNGDVSITLDAKTGTFTKRTVMGADK